LLINRVIETPDGDVKFEGTLQGAELEAVISVGLLILLQNGALPYHQGEEKFVFDEPETSQ
jgi:hypothetical protein